MILILLTLSLLAVFLASGIALVRWAEVYDSYSRVKFVHCPLCRRDSAVKVAPAIAAWTAVLAITKLQITECGLWPEKEDCGRQCRSQLLHKGG